MLGIAPSGEIIFVSKAYGGRATDCLITSESDLVGKLEPGDIILADKGFPKIVEDCLNKGTQIIMPPFNLKSMRKFSDKDNTDCYNIASVRIQVERAIQRLKCFRILEYIHSNVIHCSDKIFICICFMANNLPDLIKINN